ncbi:MAG: hypothetical protein AAF346_19575 [Pseudomonadota bacterium]
MRKRKIAGIWWVALFIVIVLGFSFAQSRLQDCDDIRVRSFDVTYWLAKRMCEQRGNPVSSSITPDRLNYKTA